MLSIIYEKKSRLNVYALMLSPLVLQQTVWITPYINSRLQPAPIHTTNYMIRFYTKALVELHKVRHLTAANSVLLHS